MWFVKKSTHELLQTELAGLQHAHDLLKKMYKEASQDMKDLTQERDGLKLAVVGLTSKVVQLEEMIYRYKQHVALK